MTDVTVTALKWQLRLTDGQWSEPHTGFSLRKGDEAVLVTEERGNWRSRIRPSQDKMRVLGGRVNIVLPEAMIDLAFACAPEEFAFNFENNHKIKDLLL